MKRACLVCRMPLPHDGRVLSHADALLEAGYAVTIVEFTELPPEVAKPLAPEDLPSRVREEADVRRLPTGALPIARSLPRALRRPLRPLLRRFRVQALREVGADVYQVGSATSLGYALRATRGRPAKVLYDMRDFYAGRWMPWEIGPRTERRNRREAALARRADGVMTVGEGLADLVAAHYGISRPFVVRHAKPRLSGALPDGRDLRADLGLPPDRPLLVHVGHSAEDTGLAEMLRAIASLEDSVLAFVGWGREIDAVPEAARALGVADRVRVVPPVAAFDVARYVRTADLAIVYRKPLSPNHLHCLPNRFFEAIAAGLPLVVADLPAMRAVIEAHGNGECFTPDGHEGLLEALRSVLERRDEYRRRATAAAETLCWENEKGRLLEAYRAVVGPP